MFFLTIDTGTPHLVVSLGQDNKFLNGVFKEAKKTHSNHILKTVDELLKETNLKLSDIDYFSASEGPGSFTGLRIGIATIQAFAYANNKKCLKVNTLDAMAYGKKSDYRLTIAMLDARNRRVYGAAYIGDKTIIQPCVSDFNNFILAIKEEVKKTGIELQEVLLAGDHVREQYAKDYFFVQEFSNENIKVSSGYYQPEVLHYLSYEQYQANNEIKSENLLPEYYALTEAERNFKRLKNSNE